MEEKDFEAKLIKLSHDIDQLDAKIDDKFSSLEEKLTKKALITELALLRDVSEIALAIFKVAKAASPQKCNTAYEEVGKLIGECLNELSEISAGEFRQRHPSIKKDVNRITRSAGIGNIWGEPTD